MGYCTGINHEHVFHQFVDAQIFHCLMFHQSGCGLQYLALFIDYFGSLHPKNAVVITIHSTIDDSLKFKDDFVLK